MRLFFIVLLFILRMSSAIAADFESINYKVQKNEGLSQIFRKFVKNDTVLNSNSPSVKMTFKSNPQKSKIDDWKKLTTDEVIQLKIEKNIIDQFKYSQYKSQASYESGSDKQLHMVEYSDDDNQIQKKFKGSLFYMASFGSFKQISSKYPTVTYQQNSPLSLGLSFSYIPSTSPWSYSLSFYNSSLTATGSNLNSESINVANEVGATVYAEYFVSKTSANIYGGIDYDSFTTFNLIGINNDSLIYNDKNSIFYLTLGLSKSFKVFNENIFCKFSFSRSVKSDLSTTYSVDNEDNLKKLSGNKFMLYLNYKFSKDFYVHSLFKYHTMSSHFDLTSYRVGIGLGYIIF